MYKKESASLGLSRRNVQYVRILRQRKERSQKPVPRPVMEELNQSYKEDACPFIRSLTAAQSGKELPVAGRRFDILQSKENEEQRVLTVDSDVNGITRASRGTISITFDRGNALQRRQGMRLNPNESALGLPLLTPAAVQQPSRKSTPFHERTCGFNDGGILGRRLVATLKCQVRQQCKVARGGRCAAILGAAATHTRTENLTTLPSDNPPPKKTPCSRDSSLPQPKPTAPCRSPCESIPRARTMYPPVLLGLGNIPSIRIKRPAAQSGCYPTCVNPRNLEQQQRLFFQSGGKYNPVFEYEDRGAAERVLATYPEAKVELLPVAIKIVEKLLADYGNESKHLEEIGGPVLTLEETEDVFSAYVRSLGLENYIAITFAENTVSPTTILHDSKGKSTVVIGLPIEYRKNRIQGVLDHELGTHFLRKFNDNLQVWAGGYRRKYDLKHYMTTEEGLAAINQLVHTVI